MKQLRIGEAVAPRRSVVTDIGGPRWHALLTVAQGEYRAKDWLLRRGAVDAFYPVQRNRQCFKGRWMERETRYLPGYLFVKFAGEPYWARIFGEDSPYIRDAIRLSPDRFGVRWPGILTSSTIEKIHAMRDNGSPLIQHWHEASQIRPGNRVRIIKGPLQDVGETQVVSIASGNAKLEIVMLGASRSVDVPLELLEKVPE
jgi:transcription antitermination factor NusG